MTEKISKQLQYYYREKMSKAQKIDRQTRIRGEVDTMLKNCIESGASTEDINCSILDPLTNMEDNEESLIYLQVRI
jgi:Tfp pilus assembly PilM family ATPase